MYRILPNPNYTAVQSALAHRYSTLENAWMDMGQGIIVDDAGEIVAFHERHLWYLQATA